jgi:hypothetical protein
VLQEDAPDAEDVDEDLSLEAELLADVFEQVAGPSADGPERAEDALEAEHQNFCGTSAK